MVKIDAHIHYAGDHPDCISALQQLDLRLINVCVATTARGHSWREQALGFGTLASQYPNIYTWCTTFNLPEFDDPGYIEHVISQLDEDFKAGAIACKLWKNIGMEIRKPTGEFLMVDDPLFNPLYEYLASVRKPLLMHSGEPLACWQPLSANNPHRGYYSMHPEWYMYDKPDYPSHSDIINARDRVLARFPDLVVVGAHLGSLEYDVRELATRLDQYPNFVVDSSARMHDLAFQDRDKVRQFFMDYQDRILFGTDIVQRQVQSSLSDSERQENLSRLLVNYRNEFTYYETGKEIVIRGRLVAGLALPDSILEKFYSINANHWYALK